MCGGSEIRCIELANAISKYTEHNPIILCEKTMPKSLYEFKNHEVQVVEHVLLPEPDNFEYLYKVDSLVVINTDCKEFSTLDYWEGKSTRHAVKIDMSRISQMVFLYNFIVSPSRHLYTISEKGVDVRILVTNRKFFEEIGKQDRYEMVRHLPRMILESPINTNEIQRDKNACSKIRIGRHSIGSESKFNAGNLDLIKSINKRYEDVIEWDFMGVPKRDLKELKKIKNVTVRNTFSIPVAEYLQNIDIFLFFVSWKREEPWSRSVAEAIASGCPILATNKGGNKDQVVHGNNGFLCKEDEDFHKAIVSLIEHKDKIKIMGKNSLLYSKFFTSEFIANKLMKFIDLPT